MRGYSRRSYQMDGLLSDIVPKVIEVKLSKEAKKELAIGGIVYAVVSAGLLALAIKISN